jgi:hypothetical protein
MKMRIIPALVGLALSVGPARGQTSMKVFVTAAQVQERKKVDEATKNALKAQKEAASEARKAKENEIKAKYGKKKEQWPPEKQEEYFAVEEAAALAEADYEYRTIEIKGINDSVQDVVESIQGKGMLAGRKERVTLAPSAAEADLVVEIRARRSSKTLPTQFKPDRCYLLFSLGPGGKLDPERFARVPATYRPGKFGYPVWRLTSPKPETPYFLFESYNGGETSIGCHGDAANTASVAIDKFIQDNGALLTTP